MWFPTRKAIPEARLRLFCFPFAGGGVSAFKGWSAGLPGDIELCPVMLPGREYRLRERAISNLEELIGALVPAITPLLDRPYAFLGYSMGARVATELAQRLQLQGAPAPLGLVVAASHAPRARKSLNAHQLSDEQLLRVVVRYDGMPQEFLAEQSLLERVLPILRADFAIVETPVNLSAQRLRCPITAWGGTQDPHVSMESLRCWRDETLGQFQSRFFPGGHFFLRSAKAAMLGALREQLEQWLSENPYQLAHAA